MPNGKPAGVRCIQLDHENRCMIFGKPERPTFCGSLQPSEEMCGGENIENQREHAIAWLSQLEEATKPV
jgi:uncharacterized protein